ncbi:MAG: LysR family transcriptional regulator [Anaerolineales bacterium]|nr:LysR family transcriptional regulator [Anaerolineales bacterium]
MLDTHQLNVFLVAAETLNFTKAAQQLHMTQPSVSQHIQALEKHFGVKLFLRVGRHLELSDCGLALVPLARDMVEQSIRLEETMISLKGEIYGHLQVGCSTTPGKYILPHLLTEFHNRHPRVKVTCKVTSQVDASRSLSEGRIHFALTSMPFNGASDVEYRKFFGDPICLLAPLDHPWAIAGEIEAEELLDEKFIMREDTSGTYVVVQDGLKQAGVPIEKLNTILTRGNSEAIALAVQEGLGLGFVSRIVETNLVQDRVAHIRIRGLDLRREIYIGRHIRKPATNAQAAFWEYLRSVENPDGSLFPYFVEMAEEAA